MKRFLILILFSVLIPIQNSSAAPSLDETLEFLVNGEHRFKSKWSIEDDCVLKIDRAPVKTDMHTLEKLNEIIYLNKVNLKKGVTFKKDYFGNEIGFILYGEKILNDVEDNKLSDVWTWINSVKSDRNLKALDHLFSNFCTGFKSAF